MLGGYLEFFMKPELAKMYLYLKKELDELIQMKVSELFGIHDALVVILKNYRTNLTFCVLCFE